MALPAKILAMTAICRRSTSAAALQRTPACALTCPAAKVMTGPLSRFGLAMGCLIRNGCWAADIIQRWSWCDLAIVFSHRLVLQWVAESAVVGGHSRLSATVV